MNKSEADTAAAKAELDTALALQKVSAGAISKLKVEEAQQGYRAAQADDEVKEASLKQTQFSLASAKHSVDVAQASLKSANFNLERCTYRARLCPRPQILGHKGFSRFVFILTTSSWPGNCRWVPPVPLRFIRTLVNHFMCSPRSQSGSKPG